MKSNRMRSKNCKPRSDDTPMKRKTPNKTGMGMRARTGVMSVDNPMQMAIMTCVKRCSLMPRKWGFSPGTWHCDSLESDWM